MTAIVSSNRPFVSKLGRWASELLLVFLGAYAAFWLNNYQQHQQDAKRRDQILASLEQNAKDEAEDAAQGANKQEQLLAEFTRSMEAGEMAPLKTLDMVQQLQRKR